MLPYRSFQCYGKEIYNISTNRYVTSVVGPGRGLLPGIIVGGVQHGSPNPDPISDQKNVIFYTRF